MATLLMLGRSGAVGQVEPMRGQASKPEVHSGLSGPEVASTERALEAPAGDPANGKVLYETYCSGCHGTSGKGDGPAAAILAPRPRDHTNRAFMATLSDGYLAAVIKRGGAALGRSPAMPPAKTLSDGDINDLIARIRSLAE